MRRKVLVVMLLVGAVGLAGCSGRISRIEEAVVAVEKQMAANTAGIGTIELLLGAISEKTDEIAAIKQAQQTLSLKLDELLRARAQLPAVVGDAQTASAGQLP